MSIFTDAELKEFHDDRWNELSEELKQRIVKEAVKILQKIDNINELKAHVVSNPLNWATPIHFYWGMWFRNQLRTEGNILDDVLPTGNWDDYYVRAVEEAIKEL